jgi:hypothetical protein
MTVKRVLRFSDAAGRPASGEAGLDDDTDCAPTQIHGFSGFLIDADSAADSVIPLLPTQIRGWELPRLPPAPIPPPLPELPAARLQDGREW